MTVPQLLSGRSYCKSGRKHFNYTLVNAHAVASPFKHLENYIEQTAKQNQDGQADKNPRRATFAIIVINIFAKTGMLRILKTCNVSSLPQW